MILDIIFALVLVYGLYLGYTRGIIQSAFAVISVLVAILASMKLSPIMIAILEKYLNWDPRILVVLGFALTFLFVMVGIRLIGKSIEKVLKGLNINFVNQLAGAIVMGGLFTVIFSWFLALLVSMNLIAQKTLDESMSYPVLKEVPEQSRALAQSLEPVFKGFWDKVAEAMDHVKEEVN
jgi:membrane protein required for colicin V production